MRRGENIFKRKDGRWEGRYICGRKENGKAIYRSVYAHSYKECSENLFMAKSSITAPRCSYTLNEMFEKWLQQRKHRVKMSTYSAYLDLYRCYIQNKIGRIKISSIEDNTLNNYVDDLLTQDSRNGSGLSVTTVRSVIIMLRSVMHYASEEFNIEDPTKRLELPPCNYTETSVFSSKEINNIIRMADRTSTYELGVLLCLYTGMRIGEICALKWESIDIDNKIIRIRKTLSRISSNSKKSRTIITIDTPKSKASIREIPLPGAIIDDLENQRQNHMLSDYFLTGSSNYIEPRSYRNHYRNMLKNVNVPYRKFHTLRHTFATSCISKGIDAKTVSTLLGHSSVKITLERYVHPNIESERPKLEDLYN